MKTRQSMLVVPVALLMSLLVVVSQESEASQDPTEPTFRCETGSFSESRYFQTIQQAAHQINAEYCSLITSKIPANAAQIASMAERLRAFAELVKLSTDQKLDIPELAEMRKQIQIFITDLSSRADNPTGLLSMQTRDKSIIGTLDKTFFFGSNQGTAQKINDTNNKACESLAEDNPTCDIYLEDLADAINPYQKNANAFNVYKTRVQLSGLSAEWESYFETGRYQNSAGIGLTTWAESAHFAQDRLVGPPPRQWHALQPSLVIENVSDAADGENIEYALSIEWVGINWWKDSPLGIPFGVSVASVYADRPDIEDIGHGFMFHFDNQYTLGVADHDGDLGIYVTLDLLKLFMNKEEQLNKYRDDVRQAVK